MEERRRLDVLVVERGLVQTRTRARALVLAGKVLVNNIVESKAGTQVATEANITLVEPDHPYVGRGGIKLTHALDLFEIAVHKRTALDIGASTGGFTDVLLRRQAEPVIALDVGRGQLAWKLRNDPRVIVLEGINARHLTDTVLPAGTKRVDIVTIDVSFISLRLVLPIVPNVLAPNGDVVALVKPQFEARRDEIKKGGIVRETTVHKRVVEEISKTAITLGLRTVSAIPSPILGAAGNREFFLHLRADLVP